MIPNHCTDVSVVMATGASRSTLWRMKKRGWAVPDYHHRKGHPPEWAARDIVILHEGLLVRSLQALKRDQRTANETDGEVWRWIENKSNRFFSFAKCCYFFGLEPDELRFLLVCLARRGIIRSRPDETEIS